MLAWFVSGLIFLIQEFTLVHCFHFNNQGFTTYRTGVPAFETANCTANISKVTRPLRLLVELGLLILVYLVWGSKLTIFITEQTFPCIFIKIGRAHV